MVTKKRLTMSEAIKQAIIESGQSYRTLANGTGIQRASIIRFMRGEQSLRLDLADKLAEHLGITVQYKPQTLKQAEKARRRAD